MPERHKDPPAGDDVDPVYVSFVPGSTRKLVALLRVPPTVVTVREKILVAPSGTVVAIWVPSGLMVNPDAAVHTNTPTVVAPAK